MRGHALLICGTDEYHFIAPLIDMQWYLQSLRFNTYQIHFQRDFERLTLQLQHTIQEANETQLPLLIVYHGHAHRLGWADKEGRAVWYPCIARLLSKLETSCLLINSCCYSLRVQPYLQQCCDPTLLGLHTPREGMATTRLDRDNNLCTKNMVAWSAGVNAEERAIQDMQFVLGTDMPVWFPPNTEKPLVQYRWGRTLDHVFFP